MKKKWNISLMVLFILIACSLLGLLTVHFIKNMFVQYSQVASYYKTYYLSKAGIELALTQVKWRGLWFSYGVWSGDDVVLQNFIFSWSQGFESTLSGRSSLLSTDVWSTTCTSPFVIWSWKTLMIPLFFDNYEWSIVESFGTGISYTNKSALLGQFTLLENQSPWTVSLGFLVTLWNELYQNGIVFMTGMFEWNIFEQFNNKIDGVFSSLEDFPLLSWKTSNDFQNYLVIANTSDHEFSFCLQLPEGESLPLQQYGIKSLGAAGWQKLGLEAIYKQPVPSYLIETSLGIE